MSINAHRIKKVVYADNGLTFKSGNKLACLIENHPETNDFRNMEGGGILELPLSALKEILNENKDLEPQEIEALTKEIAELEKEGREDGEYIQYDMF